MYLNFVVFVNVFGLLWAPSREPRHITEVTRNFDDCFDEDMGECYIHGVAHNASASVPWRAAYEGELISNEKDVVYP